MTQLVLSVVAMLMLVGAVFVPLDPPREARAAVLVVSLVVLMACTWTNPWRAGVVLAAGVTFATWRFDPAGWSTLLGLALVGQGVEIVKRLPVAPLLWTCASVGVVASAWGLTQWTLGRQVLGGLENPNTLGAVLAITGCAAFFVLWPLAFVVGLGVGVSGSLTASIAACTAAVVALVMLGGRRVALIGASASALAVSGYAWAAHPDLSSFSARLGVWTWTLWQATGRPLTGHGLGSFAALELQTGGGVWSQAHNELVQWAYEAGALGVLSVVAYLGSLATGLWRHRTTPLAVPVAAMLTATVVASCGHFTARLAATAVLAMVTLGMAEGLGGAHATQ